MVGPGAGRGRRGAQAEAEHQAEALARTFTLGQADSEADHRAGAFYRACSEGSHPQGLLRWREGGLGSPEPSVTPSVGLELSSLLFLQSPS